MLEERDAFSLSMLTTRASVIIIIIPPICLCVARRQVIRHTRLRCQCYLMLILYETTLSLDSNQVAYQSRTPRRHSDSSATRRLS